MLRALRTIGGGSSHTTLLWALNSSAEQCPSHAYGQAVLLGTQPRMEGFHGDGFWDLLGFAYWKPETPQNARQTLALEVSDSSAAPSEESPENRIWLRCRTRSQCQRRHSPEVFREGVCLQGRHCQGLEPRLCSLGLNIWAESVGIVESRKQLGCGFMKALRS